ncbi:two-component regulator propeller domain-containing protein [Flavitalea sp. BT771]|uniref:hybrid sensor histidine kinase/response regulator transcription factor n=1 Tax=Flavitalea sp. BT771 TaxID=3063329 RepID=UPI0026E19F55|nr:two-component regulator propeller domain-containing protein [Flavitalea sp. BT771]MDO6430308.1 two-component regulator propeller domain-containing protein [Flavitalea sp. BT771]MDV6219552.1 two-component regulator propeller domain-containing protein [Flavitalea sp. BT771]
MIKSCLILIGFLLVECIGYCQVNDYPFSRLDIRDGLSNNHVNDIFKDSRGYLWFGTNSGLNRYDGYSFRIFRHDEADPSSLTDDHVGRIFQGPEDKLYVSTATGGLNIYDPSTEHFVPDADAYLKARHLLRFGLTCIVQERKGQFYFIYGDSGVYRFDAGKGAIPVQPKARDPYEIPSGIADAAFDSSGGLWLSYGKGRLQRIDPGSNRVTFYSDVLDKKAPVPYGYKLFIDSRDKLWLFAPGTLRGLWELDHNTSKLTHFDKDSGNVRLSANIINSITEDDKGLLWIAPDQGGLDLLDREKLTVRNLQYSDEERSIPENAIVILYKDNMGAIWAGMLKKGIGHYQQNMLRFPLYRRQPGQQGSLPYDDANCFAEDGKGNIWIGTDGGGLIYFDRTRKTFTRFSHNKKDPNSLSSDVVVALAAGHDGKLWIGTYQGGLDCYDGKKFIHHKHLDTDPASLSDDRIYSLREDRDGVLWIGTMMGGLDRFDRAAGKFYHNNVTMPYSIHSNYISSLAEDSASNLWIGTAYGINVLSRSTGKYMYFTNDNSRLSDNIVFGLWCDHEGNMWAATRQGLSVIAPGKDSFQVFHVKDGLPSNIVLNVLEDPDHFLWVSTSGGLSKIAVTKEGGRFRIKCLNFDEYDGLQGRDFNTNAALRTRDGALLFGGPNGFNLFRPGSIGRDEHVPPVVLTGLQLYNKDVPLPASLLKDSALVLSYDENNFTLQFAALSYINVRKNQYRYRLKGFDKDWMLTDGRNRRVTYTNIDPGEYVFQVKASNSDGIWNEKGFTIKVIVKPPFWKTGFAYVLYVLIIAAILYTGRVRIIRRARARFALAEERREALRIHELDRMKIKFFTNLSHEFRTPLTLILSPVDKLIRSIEDPVRRQLAMTIERNAKRLLHLVNQLLDLRKMEVNELKLNMRKGDLAAFIKTSVESFTDLAEGKGIGLRYETKLDHLPALFDKDKVERILFNLLSNAFKFTSTGGSVVVELATVERDERTALLELNVRDTGIGIQPELRSKIFESFFQGDAPGHIRNQGTGIGLAITREFVEMHGGTIRVESAPDKGSCFTVLLQVTVLAGSSLELLPSDGREDGENVAKTGEPMENPMPLSANGERRFKVLLVEDDDDFRFYLKDNLSALFIILEAANGKDGWQKTLAAQPDLVVSDVNMPLMDGLELSRKIKGDERVHHIPVILLTALSSEQDQLRALGMGVNDYISKPFNVEILVSRIRNLLEYRGTVEETAKKRVHIQPGEVVVGPEETEEDFIRQAAEVLEKNIANPDFSVDEWSRELGLSRTTLYKRLLSATGSTPIGFIRSFRMKRAAQLLEKTRHNVAEVAYMVGFNNPKYFARYFKEVYGKLPSAYQAEKRKKG